MKDKTIKQLVEEVGVLRKQLVKHKKAETKRRRVEEALKERQETINAIIETSQDWIWAIDRQAVHTYSNPAIERILGYRKEEIVGRPSLDFMHEDDKKMVEPILQECEEKRCGWNNLLLRWRHKNGTYRYLESNAVPILNTKGDLVGFRGVDRDITAHKRAEEKLRESEKKYRTVVEISPDGIAIASKGHHVFANQSLARIFGVSGPDDLLGKPVMDYIHPDYREIVRERFEKLTKDGVSVPLVEEKMIRADGTVIQTEVAAAPLEYHGEQAVLAIIRDVTERKRLEEVLEKERQDLKLIIDSAPIKVFLKDREGKYMRVNKVYAEALKMPKEYFVGKTVFDIYSPPIAQSMTADDQDVIQSGRPKLNIIEQYESPNGLRWVQTDKVPICDEHGIPIGLICFAQDITERKQAEEALQESEERFRLAFKNANTGMCLVDLHGNLTRVNKKMCEIFGYTKEELERMTVNDIAHPEDIAKSPEFIQETLQGKIHRGTFEKRYIHKKGHVVTCQVSSSLVRNADGLPLYFISHIYDITERQRAEEALRQSEERYRTILEDIEEGYFEANLTGRPTFLNDSMCKIHGYPREELLEIDYHHFTDKENGKKVFQAFNQVYRTGKSGKLFDYEVIRKDGTKRQVEVITSLRKDSSGNPIGFRGITRDVTERKQAEAKMESLQEQLRQSQKMEAIGRLAGGIAHDFNNLLTIIKGYSQLSLIELNEDNPLKKNIEQIHGATDKAANLVRQLLAFSRRQIMEMKVLDLNAILRNLDNMLRRVIGEDIELVTVLAEDLGRVKSDPGWIEQAIMNLAVNARDAMASGGKLTIETGNVDLDEAYTGGHVAVEPGRYVMLSVSDTGVGMTPEVMEQLFEPFFSTKEKDKGTGLGLSTVYGIVKQNDGDIWVYSEPGKGTTFKIYLPRVDELLEERREKVVGDELSRGNETILLVEDEEEVRKLALRVLERQGYKVLSARQGDEALLMCKQHKGPIHLMLTDVVMPGMNGHELAKRLESLHPEMKVLYMSGYTDDAIVHHGVLGKGMNYIQKPFTVNGLTKKVREVLEQ